MDSDPETTSNHCLNSPPFTSSKHYKKVIDWKFFKIINTKFLFLWSSWSILDIKKETTKTTKQQKWVKIKLKIKAYNVLAQEKMEKQPCKCNIIVEEKMEK